MAKTITPPLVAGTDSFTLRDLAGRVAASKGLTLAWTSSSHRSEPISEPIATYVLDEELLAMLSKEAIVQQSRPSCGGEIFTLFDKGPLKTPPAWLGEVRNCWSFEKTDGGRGHFDLRIALMIEFVHSYGAQGFTLLPKTFGPLGSPNDPLPNVRMFRALVNSGRQDLPAIAHELAACSEESLSVSWADLGLGGIRRLNDLFTEFVHGNKHIGNVACRLQDVFDPNPRLALESGADIDRIDLFII